LLFVSSHSGPNIGCTSTCHLASSISTASQY
jgi:hypothetical protein